MKKTKPLFHCDAKTLALGIPRCWYRKMLKFALSPTRNPNASQWNIARVGSPGIGARVGHVHFMLFVSISFALGSQCEHRFQWNMDLILLILDNSIVRNRKLNTQSQK